jgi:CysZ protein
MLKEIFIAFRGFREAFYYSRQHRLAKWMLILGVLYVTLLFLFFVNFLPFYNGVTHVLFESLKLRERLQQGEDTAFQFLFIMGKVCFDIFLLLMCFSLYKFIFLLVSSPLFTYLNEKVIEAENPQQQFPVNTLANRILHGMWMVVRVNLWMFVFMFFLILFALIPVIGWLAPMIMLALDVYYMGIVMFAFAQNTPDALSMQRTFIAPQHRGLAVGNGIFFYALHAIPLLGWIVAPGLALVAATLNIRQLNK